MKFMTLMLASITSIALGCLLPELDYVATTLWYDQHMIVRKGTQPVSVEYKELLAQALHAMGVSQRHLVSCYQTKGVSCAGTWNIWINEHTGYGPVEYEIFHEAAHIALGHPRQRLNKAHACTTQFIKAQEIEADLLACQTLFELGMQDVIIERIKRTKPLIDKQHGSDCHPTYKEMYTYFMHFAQSKGIAVL